MSHGDSIEVAIRAVVEAARLRGSRGDPLKGRVGDDDRDVADLVPALRVAVGFGNLAQRVGAPDHVAQRSGFDQLLQEHPMTSDDKPV